jgi:cation diffusion facilitator family transporter
LAKRGRLITRASYIALAGNALLAGLKIFSQTGSLAVLGDGLDSSIDVVIALMSLFVGRIIARPADRGHPWGHGRAETVAAAIVSFLLFFAGGQLVLRSCSAILGRVSAEMPGARAFVVSLVSIAGKLLLALNQRVLGKKADSAILRANAKNMAADAGISAAVLAGICAARLTGKAVFDPLCAILIGLWVLKSAVGIFSEANTELMDGSGARKSGIDPYSKVFEAVHTVPGAGNPHRARMRRVAGLWDIDLDIEVAPSLTVREAHGIATKVEDAIKARLEGVYDIMVHIEPAGDAAPSEGYGVKET